LRVGVAVGEDGCDGLGHDCGGEIQLRYC
jgi:hypothetical protein